MSKGVLPGVYHFDGKANVEEYIRSLGIPASFFMAGFYMSNIPGMSLRQMPDGKWGFALPIPDDSPVPLFDAENDTGKFVKAMFLNEQKVLGKRVYGATAYYTPAQIVQEFKELFPSVGKDAGYSVLPGDVFKGIMASTGAPEVIQEEMLQNLRLMPEFGYYGGDSLDFSLGVSLLPKQFFQVLNRRNQASIGKTHHLERLREEQPGFCHSDVRVEDGRPDLDDETKATVVCAGHS